MEGIMELLNSVFGDGGDLAGIASAAGLGGGATSAAAVIAFRGMVMKFIVRILTTAVFTGAGFLFLLNQLGFEIVPKEEIAQVYQGADSPLYSDWAGIESTTTERLSRIEKAEREGKRVVVMRSPWSKDKSDDS